MPCTRAGQIDLAAFAVDPREPAWAEFRDHYPRCADCAREVARFGALKQALALEGTGPSAHPSEAQLLALLAPPPRLASEERARLETHLAGCAPCRTELAVVRGFNFSALAPEPGPAARPGGGGARVVWLRRPLLAAAAVLLLAIPAGLLLWHGAREGAAGPGPALAQTERGAPEPAVAKTEPKAAPVAEAQPPADVGPAAPRVAREEPRRAVTAAAEPAPIAPRPPPAAQPSPTAVAKEAPPEPLRPVEIAALLPTELPIYAPGALADGPSVRTASTVRGLSASAPVPEALGPAHVGASAHPSPNLYWFLPEPTSASVEVTVVDPAAVDPALEVSLPGPLAAGVHRVSLAERGVRLEPGVDYRWFVALVRDPQRRSQDVVSGAAIRYAPSAPDPSAGLSAAPPQRAAHVYAESGLWYDAFDQLSTWLDAEPDAARLHAHRAALLEQVGLADAAAFERSRATGAR